MASVITPREDKLQLLAGFLWLGPIEAQEYLVERGEDSRAVMRTLSALWVRKDQRGRSNKHLMPSGVVQVVGPRSGGHTCGQIDYLDRPELFWDD